MLRCSLTPWGETSREGPCHLLSLESPPSAPCLPLLSGPRCSVYQIAPSPRGSILSPATLLEVSDSLPSVEGLGYLDTGALLQGLAQNRGPEKA